MPWKERSGSGAGGRRTAGCTLQRYETETCGATAQGLFLGVARRWHRDCVVKVHRSFASPRAGGPDRRPGPPAHIGEGRGLDMMLEPVEPQIRRVVAERVGVGQEELAPEVSLADDLAVDSLDMVELALALEDEFGITVPEQVLGEVRTYQHLVDRVLDLARAAAEEGGEAHFVWARIAAHGRTEGAMEGADRVTT